MVFSGLGFGSSAWAGCMVRPQSATSDSSAIDKRKVPRRGMGVLRQAVVVVIPCRVLIAVGLLASHARVSGCKEGEVQLCRNRDGANRGCRLYLEPAKNLEPAVESVWQPFYRGVRSF